MGDRTHVTLTVLREHAEQVKQLIPDYDYVEASFQFCEFTYDQVIYGDIEELPLLLEHGIAYESHWGATHNFEAGCQILRFDEDGNYILKNIKESETVMDVYTLNRLIPTPDRIIARIQERMKQISVLDWDNQAEYGERYRLNRLLHVSNTAGD